jgi:endoglucanase
VWANYVRQFCDRVESDAYGTAWATLEGTDPSAPRIMLEAHADEIGYMIKYISKEGFISLGHVGGSDAAVARGRRLMLLGDNGPVRGIVGNTAIHLRDKDEEEIVPEVSELFVDIGAKSHKEVAKAGLRVGHYAIYADEPEEIGTNLLFGRALDNRIGGFILTQVMAELSQRGDRPAATVYAVNSVQEEIGGYGAQMVTHRLMPDVAVCLDVTHATDTPDIEEKKHGKVRLGKGPTITHGGAVHPLVATRCLEVAKEAKIKIQHEASSNFTGTDTDVIYCSREGVPSALISLPLRYMHSVVETVDYRDIVATVDLLVAFVDSVKAGDTFRWQL